MIYFLKLLALELGFIVMIGLMYAIPTSIIVFFYDWYEKKHKPDNSEDKKEDPFSK